MWPRVVGQVLVLVLLLATDAGAQMPQVSGQVHDVVTVSGDTLRALGARYGADPATIAADNGLRLTARLAVGVHLRIDARHLVPPPLQPNTIVVNVPQRMLFLGRASDVEAFPVAVGRRTWQTPLGPFTILQRERHPTWDVPASIREEARRAGRDLPAKVPPGPGNPLGDYWLGLSLGSIGIHGTNAPSSIFQAVTHGCIRLQAGDIARVFAAVAEGTAGAVVYEPILAARAGGDILLEVHPDVYRRGLVTAAAARARLLQVATPGEIDWSAVDAAVAAPPGAARSVARSSR